MQNAVEKKLVWLASYPKSGNTWFRAFITALFNEGELDINDLKTDGIFSSRDIFDYFTDLDSTYLSTEEVNLLRPGVFNLLAAKYNKEWLFIKVHEAYVLNMARKPLIPTECTNGVLYFIRNPLDIVASFANHQGFSIDTAIQVMNDPFGAIAVQKERNTANQFEQLMSDWSSHVNSWTRQKNCRVKVVRYEDMILSTEEVFSQCCEFVGIKKTQSEIKKAITASSFENLRKQEIEKSFKEKKNTSIFFRQGKIGRGKFELSYEQIRQITDAHRPTMEAYGYG